MGCGYFSDRTIRTGPGVFFGLTCDLEFFYVNKSLSQPEKKECLIGQGSNPGLETCQEVKQVYQPSSQLNSHQFSAPVIYLKLLPNPTLSLTLTLYPSATYC